MGISLEYFWMDVRGSRQLTYERPPRDLGVPDNASLDMPIRDADDVERSELYDEAELYGFSFKSSQS